MTLDVMGLFSLQGSISVFMDMEQAVCSSYGCEINRINNKTTACVHSRIFIVFVSLRMYYFTDCVMEYSKHVMS